MKNLLQLLRPHQWVKNVFVFLPLFFNGQFGNVRLLVQCGWAFMAYCCAASAIYCFNDIWDVEADRKHYKKCLRPIASGAVSKTSAYVLMGFMILLAVGIATMLCGTGRWWVLAVVLFYFCLNIAYCVWLKRIALIDVFVIALGFVLRVITGGVATGVWLSHWILIMTFLLALFLAFAKRRDDVVLYEESGVLARNNIARYNLSFMNQAITIVATISLVAYIMYTISPEVVQRFDSPFVYSTSIFVLLGILRFLQLTIVDLRSGSPTKVLLSDRFLQCCIIGWVLTFILIIYV
ncbi:MAG: decaprenyl-phosphate phosphoribosyltransferase [Bacteroidaceae bacterium]|nr:decaprenyl-phosphate phosphoribosyltransferase [Bacteroidaceae bacterium]